MARDLGFPVYDSDNHMYETEDAFTRHLPADYKGAIRYVQVDGRTKIAIKGLISEYIPNPTFEVVAPPGAQEEYYRHGNPEGKSLREIFGKPIRCPDWARNAQARLPHLDELGIQGSLMFPTLASLLEERMRDDPDLTHVVVHALNDGSTTSGRSTTTTGSSPRPSSPCPSWRRPSRSWSGAWTRAPAAS